MKPPTKRVIAKFVGTAGELLKQCKQVLGEKRTLPVIHDTTERVFAVVVTPRV